MAVPQFRDEVLVTLSSLDPPASFCFPDRRLFLTKEHPVMDIGRTSKRNSSLEASRNNCWFDSAVMSRDHAQIRFDVENQKVYLKDTSSLHGTFKNDVRVAQGSRVALENGDVLKFGVTIDRGTDQFPPCVMKTRLEFGTANPSERTNHFSVPDETDIEDSDFEGVQSILETQQRMLQAFCRRLPETATPAAAPSYEQPPVSYVRANNDVTFDAPQITISTPPRPSNIGDINNRIDLTSCPSDDESEPNGFSPISERSDLFMGMQPHEDVVLPSEGSDILITENSDGWMDDDSDEWMDTSRSESSSESLSPSPSPSPSLSPRASLMPNINSQGHFSLAEPQEVPQVHPIPAPTAIPALHNDLAREVEGDVFEVQGPPSVPAQQFTKEDYTVKLPSLVANTMPHPGMRLPSLAEATSQPPSCVRFQETQVSGFLGEKTGKTEYFRAREMNKNQAIGLQTPLWPCLDEAATTSLQPVPLVSHSFSGEAATGAPIPPQPITEISNAPEQDVSILDSFDVSPTLGAETLEVSKNIIEKSSSDAQEKTILPSAFDASSAAELQKMRREAQPSRIEQTNDVPSLEIREVDMMPAEINHEAVAGEAPETSSPKPSDPRISKKRKAADISQLTLEEGAEATTHRARSSSPYGTRDYRRRGNRVRFAEPLPPPPRKRLRRVAEVFGYAALGGVAVMSALIATAPTL